MEHTQARPSWSPHVSKLHPAHYSPLSSVCTQQSLWERRRSGPAAALQNKQADKEQLCKLQEHRVPCPGLPRNRKAPLPCFCLPSHMLCLLDISAGRGESCYRHDRFSRFCSLLFASYEPFQAAGCAHQTVPAAFKLHSDFQNPHPLLIDHIVITSGFAVCFPLQERGFRDYGLFFQFAPCQILLCLNPSYGGP